MTKLDGVRDRNVEREVRQRAYDDGYEDGRLDIAREHEVAIARLKARLNDYEQNYVPNTNEELAMHKAYASDLEAEIKGFIADVKRLEALVAEMEWHDS